jgi:hypothetical protein
MKRRRYKVLRTNPKRAVLSCFYYADGTRCQRRCPDELFMYCAHHFVELQRRSVDDLLREAAECLWANTSLDESGLPHLACRDHRKWCRLSNAMAGLGIHGYQDEDELLDLLASVLALESPWKGRGLPAKGKAFELLVARLYVEELRPLAAFARGSADGVTRFQVFWNQKLESRTGGKPRQIDVLIRWYQSPMTTLTSAVECKDTEVEVEQVESFVTKLRAVGVDRGVIVSSVGFQAGAISTAKAHDIELRHLRADDFTLETEQKTVRLSRLGPVRIWFEPDREEEPARPMDSRTSVLMRGGATCDPQTLIAEAMLALPDLDAWPPAITYKLADTTIIFDDCRARPIAQLHVELGGEEHDETVTLKRPRRPVRFTITELATGASRTLGADELPITARPQMAAGSFYLNILGQAYYCTEISATELGFVLLRDPQHGAPLFVEGTQLIEEARHYYPVEDAALLQHLRDAWTEFQHLPGQPLHGKKD